MTDPITYFRGTNYFLSNFYASPVELDGIDYPTVEHAYQAAKTTDPDVRAKVRKLDTPKAAKDMGRRIKRRPDWFNVNLGIMEVLIKQKFTRYPELRVQLLETGDAELVEGNNWNDKFFGAVWDATKSEWVGENHLGKLLMKVRQDLRGE